MLCHLVDHHARSLWVTLLPRGFPRSNEVLWKKQNISTIGSGQFRFQTSQPSHYQEPSSSIVIITIHSHNIGGKIYKIQDPKYDPHSSPCLSFIEFLRFLLYVHVCVHLDLIFLYVCVHLSLNIPFIYFLILFSIKYVF